MKPNIAELDIADKDIAYFSRVKETISGKTAEEFYAAKSRVIQQIEGDLDNFERCLAAIGDPRIMYIDGISIFFPWCVNEVINNAFQHAHKEDPRKSVSVLYYRAEKKVVASIHDEGNGFNLASVARRMSKDELMVLMRIRAKDQLPRGLGLPAVLSYIDSVEYVNNTLYLRKSLKKSYPL